MSDKKEEFVSVFCYGHKTHVELQVGTESVSMSLDDALEYITSVVGAAQNTARFAGMSNAEFNARLQKSFNASSAAYAKAMEMAS
jgi:hypothetical protein